MQQQSILVNQLQNFPGNNLNIQLLQRAQLSPQLAISPQVLPVQIHYPQQPGLFANGGIQGYSNLTGCLNNASTNPYQNLAAQTQINGLQGYNEYQ